VAASDPTDVPADVPEQAVDELYALPVTEFTSRRDALARDLRGAGEREAAAWVKGLRKPSAPAWIVNQLARARAREAKDLLRAGDALRAAHERVVAGTGDADELRAAAETEHAAARALVADAPGLLDRDGHAPSRATLEKVTETIRAVALDDEARAGFERGRLTRERTASGFGPATGVATSKGRPRSGSRGGRDAGSKDRVARDAARQALEEARAEQRERAREVRAAERELAGAQREGERVRARLERAEADLERARSRESRSQARVSRAETELGR
jgi:hypothetical protein